MGVNQWGILLFQRFPLEMVGFLSQEQNLLKVQLIENPYAFELYF